MNDINNSLKSTSYKKPFPYHHENPMVPDGETFVKPKINMSGVTTDITDQETVAIRGFYENLITKGSNAPAGLSLWQAVPNSPNSPGEEGWMAYDGNYHYIYVGGKWMRNSFSSWSPF